MPQGSLAKPNGRWVHDHLLSLTLFALFVVSWIGQLYFQYQHELDEAMQDGGETFSVFSAQFMNSFWASTLENWQSEFLQLLSFVVLTTYLIHRYSHESRDSNDEMAADIRAIKNKLEE
jgi:surface polysaccharide O-acyltransferase-like enzyme